MVDEGDFWDTAGAVPSNGVLVRDLRTLVVARTRQPTLASIFQAVAEFVAFRTASDDRWAVVVERAGTGERLAERQFRSRARAMQARARFVHLVESMPESTLASANWEAVLSRS